MPRGAELRPTSGAAFGGTRYHRTSSPESLNQTPAPQVLFGGWPPREEPRLVSSFDRVTCALVIAEDESRDRPDDRHPDDLDPSIDSLVCDYEPIHKKQK